MKNENFLTEVREQFARAVSFFIFHSSFLIGFQEHLTLFQTEYFEWDKTTGKSNDMVWTQQYCGQVHQLSPNAFAYLFLCTSTIWRHITSICLCGLFEHHFHVWHGNVILPIYTKH